MDKMQLKTLSSKVSLNFFNMKYVSLGHEIKTGPRLGRG